MSELTTKKRNRLQDKTFAYVDKDGDRHLPLNDESHIRNAMSRFSQTDFDSASEKKAAARKIVRAAKRERVEIDKLDKVVQAAKSK